MARFSHSIPFPFLALLLSGGHSLIVYCRGVGDYLQLGTTLDDSVGEVIDKASRALQFPYDHQEGPAAAFSRAAQLGASNGWSLPQPRSKVLAGSCNFSFSGIKSAFLHLTQTMNSQQLVSERCNLARTFLDACTEHIVNRLGNACNVVGPSIQRLVISGGVARNNYIMNRYAPHRIRSRLRLINIDWVNRRIDSISTCTFRLHTTAPIMPQ